MSSDREFAYNKSPKRVYFSSEFKIAHVASGKVRPKRYVSRVMEAGDRPQLVDIKGETVLRTTPGGRNPWIFGYGLFYVFSSAFSKDKLEQYVAGASVGSSGKRVDALLRTRGLVSSLCFAEIKTHKTPLLQAGSHRSDTWAPSRELVEAVTQVQKTVDAAEQQLGRRVEPRDEAGAPTDRAAYLMRPRSVVVVGSLGEFQADRGINEPRFTSFELFRRQLVAPEVVTFDELYERARFIVEQAATS